MTLTVLFLSPELLEEQARAAEVASTPKPVKKNVGEDILKKMGWKGKGHGKFFLFFVLTQKGLGRNEQGMALPLLAKKSGTGAQGIIVNQSHMELQKKCLNPTGTQSSRVIVLTVYSEQHQTINEL